MNIIINKHYNMRSIVSCKYQLILFAIWYSLCMHSATTSDADTIVYSDDVYYSEIIFHLMEDAASVEIQSISVVPIEEQEKPAISVATNVPKFSIPEMLSYHGKEYPVASILDGGLCHADTLLFPNSLRSIGLRAFNYCPAKYVVLPPFLESMAYACFEGAKVVHVDMSQCKVLNELQTKCFVDCTDLTTCVMPPNVELISDLVFDNCSSLKSIAIPKSVKKMGSSVFRGCQSLETMKIPDSFKSISPYTFNGCKNLSEVIISQNAELESINEGAFCGCKNLRRISLPEKLNTIGSEAFGDCTNLREIYVYNSTPPTLTDKNAFEQYNATIYVPKGSRDAYEKNPSWILFSNIEEMASENVYYMMSITQPLGRVGVSVKEGERQLLRFVPDEGYQVHSITFNETDVTSLLDEDLSFRTPAITSDAIVSVVFEKVADNISVTESASSIQVKVSGQHILVSGATSGETMQLYNADGQLVTTSQANTEGRAMLNVEKNGLYILSSKRKSFKMRL